MTTNALATYEQFDTMQRAALALHESGYFADTKSKAQAIVKVMAGAELGLAPFAAMTGIHIIKGKPSLSAGLIATLVKNDPRYDYRVKSSTDKECILTWYEDGKPVGEAGFTIEEAKTAGLLTNNTWKAYPSDMLFARAVTRGARRYAPGIFGGAPVYTPDELGADVDMDGNIIDVTPEIVDVSEPVVVAQGNGNGQVLPDDEQAVYDAPAGDFLDLCAALIDRYDNIHAVKNALKKIGATGIPKSAAARVDLYRQLREHAAQRDAETVVEQVNGDLFGETAKAPMDAYSE